LKIVGGLEQLAFKGHEGSSEEETTLAEETVFLQSGVSFIGRGQNLHGGWVSELGFFCISPQKGSIQNQRVDF
jgi:hypothetical protein